MALTLTNIPRIMRRNGWANGARLMDIWFSRAPAVMPKYGPPDTATIRMDTWELTFARARAVYDAIMSDRIWANTAAQARIATVLRARGLLGTAPNRFDDTAGSPDGVHDRHVNFRTVAQTNIMSIDDMDAALANFAFYVVIGGNAAPESGRHRVTIETVGVYVLDSYDFNGDQDLGYWNESTNEASTWNPLVGDNVTNATFRSWRAAHGRGGDFQVFSDIKVTRLSAADTFLV